MAENPNNKNRGGWTAPAVAVPALGGILVANGMHRSSLIGLTIGLFVAGLLCLLLGLKWKRQSATFLFLGFKGWGILCLLAGAVCLFMGLNGGY